VSSEVQLADLLIDSRHINKRHLLSICFKKLYVDFLGAVHLVRCCAVFETADASKPVFLGPNETSKLLFGDLTTLFKLGLGSDSRGVPEQG
jgi:hypothetical protein